ncbi:methyltransferase family protein [Methyloceanibacter caenitepidi]|uniref:CzcN domain protein n=1 Tax=Methyloceanibacter caenitepidi TaxID=1384459 RepID=A0A0A8K5C2_9HYPH|nr:PEMT/PEM2 methyltransferase family protein [Methyloceanibacter caenitepidi]BAQ17961.1 CzcN domain protein [Methyloceanibacter caenitepidi]
MIDFSYTHAVFVVGLIVGITLNFLMLRTLFFPPFRIWPTPGPGTWQSVTFWTLFRAGMVLTFVMGILDWNSAGLVDLSRLIIGLPLFLVGFGITVFGYFNLGLGNTYCGEDGLISHGLYRFSRNPQYASSILGLIGTVIMADSWLTVPLAFSASCVYVLMALTEEQWLEDRYGATYLEYKNRTARFFDLPGFIQYLVEKTQPSRRTS